MLHWMSKLPTYMLFRYKCRKRQTKRCNKRSLLFNSLTTTAEGLALFFKTNLNSICVNCLNGQAWSKTTALFCRLILSYYLFPKQNTNSGISKAAWGYSQRQAGCDHFPCSKENEETEWFFFWWLKWFYLQNHAYAQVPFSEAPVSPGYAW